MIIPSRNSKDEKGFTLVEVLVAIAIFSVVLLTLFSSFDAFLNSSRIIRDHQTVGAGKEPGLSMIRSDLEQLFVPQTPQYQKPELRGENKELPDLFRFHAGQISIRGASYSFLSFVSLSPVQPNGFKGDNTLGLTRLTYYVHAREDRLDLLRADRPVFLDPEKMENRPCSDPIVIKDIKGFDLFFFNPDEKTIVWDSDHRDFGFGLPRRVVIRVLLNGEAKEAATASSVLLPVKREVAK